MPTHAETRLLPYTPAQLFDLIADINSYTEFLPWCLESRITKQTDTGLEADLVVGYKFFREKFTSQVTLHHTNKHIYVKYLSGPFRSLNNHWKFIPAENNHCKIDFYLDFEFHTHLFQKMFYPVFNEAVRHMITAFEKRAAVLYGGETQRHKTE